MNRSKEVIRMLEGNDFQDETLKNNPISEPVDKKSCLIIDLGLGLTVADYLSKTYNVYYYIPSNNPYPCLQDTITGDGFNITKVDSFYHLLDQVEFILFIDNLYSDLPDYLKSKGYKVFGVPKYWSDLEHNKIKSYEEIKKFGLEIPNYTVVEGINQLTSYLEKATFPKIIKINKYRGNVSTFKCNNIDAVRYYILQSGLGPYVDTTQFIIEDVIIGDEFSITTLFNGKDFLLPYQISSYCDGLFIGRWSKSKVITGILEQFKSKLIETKYQGIFGVELFKTESGFIITDLCPRFGIPQDIALSFMMSNFSDVILNVTNGSNVELLPTSIYNIGMELTLSGGSGKWSSVDIENKYKDRVVFGEVTINNGNYYHVPVSSIPLSVFGLGMTIEDAFKEVKEIATGISVTGSGVDSIYSFEYLESMKKTVQLLDDLS